MQNCYPLLTFSRRQHVENTFRIFDVFERVMLGQSCMEVSLAGMGLTYFPREILQCSLLKVRADVFAIAIMLTICVLASPFSSRPQPCM